MKKTIFVALVLFSSLILLQYVLLTGIMSSASTPEKQPETQIVHPAKNQMFDAGDHIVVLKDGKYFVYEKKLPST